MAETKHVVLIHGAWSRGEQMASARAAFEERGDANITTDQIQAGNLLDAFLDPTSANTALVPYDLLVGAEIPLFAVLGTAVNLADLFS